MTPPVRPCSCLGFATVLPFVPTEHKGETEIANSGGTKKVKLSRPWDLKHALLAIRNRKSITERVNGPNGWNLLTCSEDHCFRVERQEMNGWNAENPTGDIDGILSACGPGRRFQHMVMLPVSVNLIAFDSRFVRICCSLQSGSRGLSTRRVRGETSHGHWGIGFTRLWLAQIRNLQSFPLHNKVSTELLNIESSIMVKSLNCLRSNL